jgi:predicted metal-dependent hydrolase
VSVERSKHDLKARVRTWADELDVSVASLTVRPMRRKWASCSTSGALSFSTDLLSLEGELVDYVIVHELLHLRAPNHGRLWKSLMRAHLGEYEPLHQRLREQAGSVLSGATEGTQ